MAWTFTEKKTKASIRAEHLLKRPRKSAVVGVFGTDALKEHPESDSGATFVEVAVWNEYGTYRIPSRSWLRDYFDGKADAIAKELAAATLRVIYAGESEEEALTKIAGKHTKGIKSRIKKHIPPPNAKSTLRRKRGDTPLIDSGALFKIIKFEVRD